MAIIASELKLLKTTNNLGGTATATEVVTATMNNIFRNITSAETVSGITLYACIYLKNANATLTATAVKQWLSANSASADTDFAIGLGTSAKNGTEQTIANETTAPIGVTFSAAANEAASIALPDLAPNDTQAMWIRYTVNAGATAVALDSCTIETKVDTPV